MTASEDFGVALYDVHLRQACCPLSSNLRKIR